MKSYFKTKDKAVGNLIMRPELRSGIRIGGVFETVCRGADGKIKWIDKSHNLVTNEGLDSLLDVYLHAATQITTWYVAPFETDTTILATHTYAVPGYTESTAYSEGTRQEYEEAAASGQSITNSANKASLSINATKTMYGVGLVGGGSAPTTKGNTAGGGTLFCAVQFATARAVISGDTLEITYTLTSADDGA